MQQQFTVNPGVTYCRMCGAQMAAGTAFCSACGQPVSVSPVVPEAMCSPHPKKSVKKWWIAVVAVVAAVAVVLGCFLFSGKPDHEKAFEAFEKVYFQCEFDGIASMLPPAMWDDYQDGHKEKMSTDPECEQEWREIWNELQSSYEIDSVRRLDTVEIGELDADLYENTGYRVSYEEAYEYRLLVNSNVGGLPYLGDMTENGETTYYLSLYAVKVQGSWYIVSYRKGNLNFSMERIIDKWE